MRLLLILTLLVGCVRYQPIETEPRPTMQQEYNEVCKNGLMFQENWTKTIYMVMRDDNGEEVTCD